ncbi:MAG: hypothetical protein AAGI27_00655 [Pseudomonadota bacterium]
MSKKPEEMTRDELHAAISKSEREVAYLQGRADAAYEQTVANKDLREVVRVKAWLATERGIQISFDYAADDFIGVPDGWPDDVDPDETVRNHVDSVFNRSKGASTEKTFDSPGLAAYRKLMGD